MAGCPFGMAHTRTHTHTQEAKAIALAAVEILEYNTFSLIISSTLLVDFYVVGYDYDYCCNCLATIIHIINVLFVKLFMKVVLPLLYVLVTFFKSSSVQLFGSVQRRELVLFLSQVSDCVILVFHERCFIVFSNQARSFNYLHDYNPFEVYLIYHFC